MEAIAGVVLSIIVLKENDGVAIRVDRVADDLHRPRLSNQDSSTSQGDIVAEAVACYDVAFDSSTTADLVLDTGMLILKDPIVDVAASVLASVHPQTGPPVRVDRVSGQLQVDDMNELGTSSRPARADPDGPVESDLVAGDREVTTTTRDAELTVVVEIRVLHRTARSQPDAGAMIQTNLRIENPPMPAGFDGAPLGWSCIHLDNEALDRHVDGVAAERERKGRDLDHATRGIEPEDHLLGLMVHEPGCLVDVLDPIDPFDQLPVQEQILRKPAGRMRTTTTAPLFTLGRETSVDPVIALLNEPLEHGGSVQYCSRLSHEGLVGARDDLLQAVNAGGENDGGILGRRVDRLLDRIPYFDPQTFDWRRGSGLGPGRRSRWRLPRRRLAPSHERDHHTQQDGPSHEGDTIALLVALAIAGSLLSGRIVNGLIWTLVIWSGLFLFLARYRHRLPMIADWYSREHLALVVALLGTFSIAASSEAAEVIRQPVVLERVIRGAMAGTALLLVLPLLVRRIGNHERGHRALGALVVYLLISAVSTVYSAAPLVTAAKAVELGAGLAPVVAIALGERPAYRLRGALYLVLALMASLQVVALVGFFLLPGTFASFQSRPGFVLAETMVSPFSHSNALAAQGALLAVFCLAGGLSGLLSRRVAIVGGLASLATVVLASGRQGVAIALAGGAAVLWGQRRTLFLTLLGPGLVFLGYIYRDALFEALARNRPRNFTNFSGRLYWWEAAIEAWSAHPWTGWGYSAGGRFVALASLGRGSTSSVHSGYLEALVGVGVFGLAALLYALYQVVAWSLKNLSRETALATLIVPLALRTAIGPGFGGWLNVEFVIFALLCAIADRTRIDRSRDRVSAKPPVVVGQRRSNKPAQLP